SGGGGLRRSLRHLRRPLRRPHRTPGHAADRPHQRPATPATVWHRPTVTYHRPHRIADRAAPPDGVAALPWRTAGRAVPRPAADPHAPGHRVESAGTGTPDRRITGSGTA